MKSFNSTVLNLQSKLALEQAHGQQTSKNVLHSNLSTPPRNSNNTQTQISLHSEGKSQGLNIHIPFRTINMIRLIMTWSFHRNLLRLQTPSQEVSED